MSSFQSRNFLFCSQCGTLLSFDSVAVAKCPLCLFTRNASEIAGREIRYTVTAEDIRRKLNLETFVLLDSAQIEEETVQRPVVDQECPQCHHPQLEYYTKQRRSADEGQTTFFECPKCSHTFAEQ